MENPGTSWINCLQWGLRVLPPDKYFNLLKRYTKKLFPCAYEEIYKAHNEDRGKYWWWRWLCFYISDGKKCVNIATGRRVSEFNSPQIGVFANWTQYEKFREALREATERYFGHQSNSG